PPPAAAASPPSAAAAPSAPPSPPASGQTAAGGIVLYPDYAAVVAQQGDTVAAMAARAGLSASELAAYNGLPLSYVPSAGDELVLPPRPGGYAAAASAAAPPTGAAPAPSATAPLSASAGAAPPSPSVDPVTGWSPAAVGAAIDDVPAESAASAPPPATGRVLDGAGISREVVYHDVQEDETVFSIARTYGLPAETLIAWNALSGPNYTVRPGQVLTVPAGGPPPSVDDAALIPTVPGQGGEAAPPPSAGAPLPPDTVAPQPLASPQLGRFQTETAPPPAPVAPAPAIEPAAQPEAPSVAALAAPAAGDRLLAPVPGRIVKPYSREPGPNRNDGVDFAASPGEEVRAAAAGEVALVSTSLGEWGTIVLLRHSDGLMTVYGRLGSSTVSKGQQVDAGQVLGAVAEPTGTQALMHFEVRRGAFSENPEDFL
ncbi:MAG: LysM peptidoglycan-binding domain-containing M23 family metallopeptidase, partial [Pseudomonadota bacterium]